MCMLSGLMPLILHHRLSLRIHDWYTRVCRAELVGFVEGFG